MSDNIKKPSSSTAKPQKLLLFPGDPLIKTLKPDHYIIVDPSTLEASVSNIANGDEGDSGSEGGEEVADLGPPNLEDITLVSKKLVTAKDKTQYIEFVFNIKNHVGDTVVGVNGYGQ
jgi:hypothetical protein